ncbi:MAG: hypothetical protein JSR46_00755 [Verrucomicrobia bacterium]|nr:hypothetical protein [Verrucomicrobiota bacterium]
MRLQPHVLRYLNIFLLICLTSLLGVAIYTSLDSSTVDLPAEKILKPTHLPRSFAPKSADLAELDTPFLQLATRSNSPQLPDLRAVIVYYGANHRPDSAQDNSSIYIGLRGGQSSIAVNPHTPIYLNYTGKASHNRWAFSKKNSPTPIWITLEPSEKEARVSAYMKDKDGLAIDHPPEFASFTVNQTRQTAYPQGGANWQIGEFRVDGSLLGKYKAVWHGQDLFLRYFGGDEFAYTYGRERIEFKHLDAPYHCFVQPGTCLIFEEGRWQVVEPGADTRNKSLLVVQNVTERTILFDLWDPEGKNKIAMQLHKTPTPHFSAEKFPLKLAGARSKKDWIAQIGNVRILVGVDDWLLFYNGMWQKITGLEQLDNYVKGQIRGPLIVIEGTEKNGNEVNLVARVFDESRTQELPLKVSLSKSWVSPAAKKRQAAPSNEDDEDEDDDDEDDDDEEYDDDEDDYDEDDDEDDEI